MTKELSIFIDESGSDDLKTPHYLTAFVFHDQSFDIAESIGRYEEALRAQGLPNISFHAEPLMNGHRNYQNMTLETRARLLSAFRVFFRHLPIRYKVFSFRSSDYDNVAAISVAMRKKLIAFLFDNIEPLQSFDEIKVYYDGGQASIDWAIHKALGYVLWKEAVSYRATTASEYRLAQAADYICCLESAAIRYHEKHASATDEKFFGGWSRFKKGPLKELRTKLM